MSWKLLTLLTVVVVAVSAGVVNITPCRETKLTGQSKQSDQVEETKPKCAVHRVLLTPYTYADQGFTSQLYLRIVFDFTPNFNATRLEAKVFFNYTEGGVAKDMVLSEDACRRTECPSEAGKEQSFATIMELRRHASTDMYAIQFQVYDEADITNMCCIDTVINAENLPRISDDHNHG